MSPILSWVVTLLKMSFVDAPLLALRSCCGVGMEGAEAVAVTVLVLLPDGRAGPGMAEGGWE